MVDMSANLQSQRRKLKRMRIFTRGLTMSGNKTTVKLKLSTFAAVHALCMERRMACRVLLIVEWEPKHRDSV